MTGRLKSLWARYWLRNAKFTGRYEDLERLYAISDPWNLSSAKEQARFEASNALIRSLVPDCAKLLEIGCGEGLQTVHLLEVSRSVAGMDVSDKAVARARARCPAADLKVGKAEDVASLFSGRRFDIVTAFEVLYYAQDIPRVLGALQQLSDTLLVTNFADRAALMQRYFTGEGWHRLPDIVSEGVTWECHVWRKP